MTNTGTPQVGDVWSFPKGQVRITKVTSNYILGQVRSGSRGRFTAAPVRFERSPIHSCIRSA